MENDIMNSLFLFGLNTPSHVMKHGWPVDKQENAMKESILHSLPPKTDEDVAIYDALERPRPRARLSPMFPGSGIGNITGASSPASGGGNWRTPMSGGLLNPCAPEFTPMRFAHSEQELRSGTSNSSRAEICRVSGGSSVGLNLPPFPSIYPSYTLSPIPVQYVPSPLPSNNFHRSHFENLPRTPSPMAPPQPPFLVRTTPETTPHRPTTTSSAKSKSPIMKLPSASTSTSTSTSVQSPLYSDWVPLDDGIDCTLPPGLTRNETRISVLLSAGSNPDGTPDRTLSSAGSTHNRTLSTLTSGSTQNSSVSADQSQTFSREELDDYMNRVRYEVRPRKRLPVFEKIAKSESNE